MVFSTTSRIAERAGVSVGSLYQYFPKEMVMMTLGQVGKAISERGDSLEVADRYAGQLADMLCGYLERLAREAP